ncbi:MAG: hypothetical protein IJK27_04310 [Bacilli bacterium]|nr:hypothetical protein [Bacilli bacterium]
MLIINSFGKNIIIGDQVVGYIQDNELIISRKKFADITDDGIISYNDSEIGFVDDDGAIIIHDKEVGYIDDGNNFVFYKSFAKM